MMKRSFCRSLSGFNQTLVLELVWILSLFVLQVSSFLPTPIEITTGKSRGLERYKQENTRAFLRRKDNDVNKGFFNVLEIANGIIPQGALVATAQTGWKLAWKQLMTELAPQDSKGNYQRPSYQTKLATLPLNSSPPNEILSRYHLYLGNPCPWCHRVKLAQALFNLSSISTTTLVDDPVKASRGGWILPEKDPRSGASDLRQVYESVLPGYTGRCTAPLLIDTESNQFVSNESKDIVRLLQQLHDATRTEADERVHLFNDDDTNEWVYQLLNNGVYRCGFCTSQAAYNQAYADVQEGLRRANERLGGHKFLGGDEKMSVADVYLFPTLIRFDGAYGPLFRASRSRIRDYPNLKRWLKDMWNIPGVSDTIDLKDAVESYYRQLFPLNPSGIVPAIPITIEEILDL